MNTILATLTLALSFLLGDQRFSEYLPLLEGKKVAAYTNHTGIAGDDGRHIVDILVEQGVDLRAILAPEHGFRGTADAGEGIEDGIDSATGIPVVSLYGRNKGRFDTSPFDVILVDIQDVGLRWYTYYITMLRLMESAAVSGCKVIILDRPNPNGGYTDGPVLADDLHSGVGALPIPVVHGLTLGELAMMAQGEGWTESGCELTVIPCEGYTHSTEYELPVPPSPNLKSMRAVLLYASTCLFEGTNVSLGRGTEAPFEMYGAPWMEGDFSFTPKSVEGAKHPPYEGIECHGTDLRGKTMEEIRSEGFTLEYIIDAYMRCPDKESFFLRNGFFDLLAGRRYVREMIQAGASADQIRRSWLPELEDYRRTREKYLLYLP